MSIASLIAVALAAVFTAQGDSARSVPPKSGTLDIYWIDVEGGASTLIVTPSGQSVLMDAGFAGFNDRDAARIEHVVTKEAGLRQLDFVLVSHFHGDHAGGLGALSRRVKIAAFVDHGDSVEGQTGAGGPLWHEYNQIAGTRRRTVKPGERLPLKGVELVIVAGHGQVLPAPVADSQPNQLCESFKPQPEDRGENGQSLGYLLRSGKFEFVNLGDLSWNFSIGSPAPSTCWGVSISFKSHTTACATTCCRSRCGR